MTVQLPKQGVRRESKSGRNQKKLEKIRNKSGGEITSGNDVQCTFLGIYFHFQSTDAIVKDSGY